MSHLHPTEQRLRHSFQSPDLWFIDFAPEPETACAEVPGSSHSLSVIASSISLFLYFSLDLFYGQLLPQRMLSLPYTHSHLPALSLCVEVSKGALARAEAQHGLILNLFSKKHIPPTSTWKAFLLTIISCYQMEKSCKVMFEIVPAEPIQVKKQMLCFFVVRKGAPQHL